MKCGISVLTWGGKTLFLLCKLLCWNWLNIQIQSFKLIVSPEAFWARLYISPSYSWRGASLGELAPKAGGVVISVSAPAFSGTGFNPLQPQRKFSPVSTREPRLLGWKVEREPAELCVSGVTVVAQLTKKFSRSTLASYSVTFFSAGQLTCQSLIQPLIDDVTVLGSTPDAHNRAFPWLF